MNWSAWWCGWACASTVGAVLAQRWGWALFAGGFAALYGWWARQEAKEPPGERTVPLDPQSGALAAGFMTIGPDEVATVEVVTHGGEHVSFSVWRNT